MIKRKVLLVGKLPPPYMGPSIAFQILINSELNQHYDLSWFNVQVNRTLSTLGKWSIGKVRGNISLYVKFYQKLRIDKPELALIPISQSTSGFIKDSIFIMLCIVNRTPVVIQLRGSNFKNWIEKSSRSTGRFVKYVLSKTEGVIVLGNKLKYLFADYYSNDKIWVVPNGANIVVPKIIRKENTLVNIIYLGNLQRSKGIEDLLEAVRLLYEKVPDTFNVMIAGNWREPEVKSFCLNMVQQYHLPVHFMGELTGEQKLKFLAEADVFVFTPKEPEGHPWAVIEAMAASLPVISTDQGAISESIADGVNGFIVPVNKPDQTAEKLRLLITDPILRKRMGDTGFQVYRDKYTEGNMVQNYCRVFDIILKSNRFKSS
jgi:glycosyltransferase involved in cell wall biosynthesis